MSTRPGARLRGTGTTTTTWAPPTSKTPTGGRQAAPERTRVPPEGFKKSSRNCSAGSPGGSERPTARALVEELDGIVREIEESGAHLKDIRLGLVDFPAERNGEVVYLCWQFGEPEVAFWHRVEEGFVGRQPLPGIARARTLQ